MPTLAQCLSLSGIHTCIVSQSGLLSSVSFKVPTLKAFLLLNLRAKWFLCQSVYGSVILSEYADCNCFKNLSWFDFLLLFPNIWTLMHPQRVVFYYWLKHCTASTIISCYADWCHVLSCEPSGKEKNTLCMSEAHIVRCVCTCAFSCCWSRRNKNFSKCLYVYAECVAMEVEQNL